MTEQQQEPPLFDADSLRASAMDLIRRAGRLRDHADELMRHADELLKQADEYQDSPTQSK